jgi:hypothetical protein
MTSVNLLAYMRPATLQSLIEDLTAQLADNPDDTTLEAFLRVAANYYYTHYYTHP